MASYVSPEQENYFKIVEIVLNVIPENLREKFKVRWKDVYGSEWTDDAHSGLRFDVELRQKSIWYRPYRCNDEEKKIKAGDTSMWDCTTLFFAFRSLNLFENAAEEVYIYTTLRETRNDFAHMPTTELSENNYKRILSEIKTTFRNLDFQNGLEAIRHIDESKLENDHFRELEQQLIAERKQMDGILDDHEQRISALENAKGHSQSEKVFKVPSNVENFVGRDEVIDKMKEEIEKHSFVVLHGFACYGKSAVGTTLAHQLEANYDNVVMADVRSMILKSTKKDEFEKMCTRILSKLNLDISDAANDNVCYMETKLRQLKNNEKKTLLILDNIEEVIPPKNEAKSKKYETNSIKQLVDIVSENCAGWFKIVGLSRYPVAQSVFPDSVNVEIDPLNTEESREFLKTALPNNKQIHVDLLVEKCKGVPLILDVISKMLLNEIGDDRYLLERIEELPLIAVSDDIKGFLKVVLESISSKEQMLMEILCVFPSSFSRHFADKLWNKLDEREIPFESLEAKGMLTKSSGLGHSLHPFLRESVMEERDILKYEAALISVYIEYLFDISDRSFEKDESPRCVADFNEQMYAYDHLMTLIDKMFNEERISSAEETSFVRGTLQKDDPCFIVLMRFLYYLVPKKEIWVLFNYFKEHTDGSLHSTLNACIDETIAAFTDRADKSMMDRYEEMMFDMRKLYDQLDTSKTPAKPMPVSTLEKFVQALENKIKVLEGTSQQHKKVMAYYQLKFCKLAGKFHAIKKGNRKKQRELLEASLEISLKNFGDSFLTIDCHERIAVDMRVENEDEKAEEHFREAYKVAERSGLLGQKKMANLYFTMGKFLLKTSEQQKQAEGLELLLKALKCDLVQIVHDHEDTGIEMFDKSFDRIIKMHTIIYDKVEIKQKMNECMKSLREVYSQFKDKPNSEKLLKSFYKWHRMLATHTPHIVLEQERKQYAEEALRIKKEYPKLGNEQDPDYLNRIVTSTIDLRKQEILLDISFLEKVNETIMKYGKSDEVEAHIEEILSLLKQSSEEDSAKKDESLIEDWMRLKLVQCLLTLDCNWPEKLLEPNEVLEYFKEMVEFVEDKQLRQGAMVVL